MLSKGVVGKVSVAALLAVFAVAAGAVPSGADEDRRAEIRSTSCAGTWQWTFNPPISQSPAGTFKVIGDDLCVAADVSRLRAGIEGSYTGDAFEGTWFGSCEFAVFSVPGGVGVLAGGALTGTGAVGNDRYVFESALYRFCGQRTAYAPTVYTASNIA